MDLESKISSLPHLPGVYRYYDTKGNVIYVGKAKDLHKRVAQYFVDRERLTRKTRILVSKIADIQYSVVDTEADALLLENNLIKEYKPRYNILLKDSKTYPWICITNEDYPRVFLTRKIDNSSYLYYGPYSSVAHARALLELFSDLYPLRTCSLNITPEAIKNKKFRPCLQFHIKRCRACCTGNISIKEYRSYIDEIVEMLGSGARNIISHYKKRMFKAADELDFETAESYKAKIDLLNNHYSKSIINNLAISDLDVFSLDLEDSNAFGNFMRIRGGAIVKSINLSFTLNIEESPESVLSQFIAEISAKFGDLSQEIIVPFIPDVTIDKIVFKVPLKGDKRALLELSIKNAKELKFNILRQRELKDPTSHYDAILQSLQKALGMNVLPRHIECFDNSNIQGTNPVASCVVFRDGKASKKDYRKFKIKTVVGANDYASMKEVVYRRYSRLLQENKDDLPQLVVIDGGRGQLAFAYQALSELKLTDKLTVIGLAKRLEEVIRVSDPYPLFIDRNASALRLLQQIRDEAHRFGISFHRSLRSKEQIHSILRDIKGLGEKTEQKLLMKYGSVERMKTVSINELTDFLGNKNLAKRINETLININNES